MTDQRLADVVDLPLKVHTENAMPLNATGMRLQTEIAVPLWFYVFLVTGCCSLFWRWLMKDDIANAWESIKSKRAAALAAAHEESSMLRKQIDDDGLSDRDRAAIDEMKAEAAK